MKNLKQLTILVAGMAWVALGCSKGSTGPQGPAGPDSITYSAWIPLNMAYSSADSLFEQNISAPAITQRILDNGVILTYLSFIDNNNVTNVVNAATYFYNEIFIPGEIELGSIPDYTGISYRYVTIPGTTQANSIISGPAKGFTKQQLQTMSYEAVQKLLGSAKTTSPN